MYRDNKILAIIPARGGSKRLPGKNIKKIGSKPMIAHAVLAAKKSKYIDRIVVSTDDPAIVKVVKKYGAEVPFVRPAEFASDTAPTLPVLQHAVRFYENELKFKPDLIILVQTTNPLIKAEDIDKTIETLFKTKTNTCFTVTEISQRPEWMYRLDGKKPELFIKKGDGLKTRSQNLPRLGIINGTVYAMKYDTLIKKNKIYDKNTSVYIMPRDRSVDIDNYFDFKIAEALIKYNEEK